MGPGGQIAAFDGHFLRAYIGNIRGVIGHHTSSQSLYGQHIHQLYPDAVAAIGRAHIHANLPHCLAICTDTSNADDLLLVIGYGGQHFWSRAVAVILQCV